MAKASQRLLVHCLVAILVFALVECGGNELTICNIALDKLDVCRPAVTGKYPTLPSGDCCDLIKHANMTCLCAYKKYLPAFKIDPARALELPKKCHLHTPPQCNA